MRAPLAAAAAREQRGRRRPTAPAPLELGQEAGGADRGEAPAAASAPTARTCGCCGSRRRRGGRRRRTSRARARIWEMAGPAPRQRCLASRRGCRARWISKEEGEAVGCLFHRRFCFFTDSDRFC
jgi:hypothetical protein